MNNFRQAVAAAIAASYAAGQPCYAVTINPGGQPVADPATCAEYPLYNGFFDSYNSSQATNSANAAISFSVLKYRENRPSGGTNPHEDPILTKLVDPDQPRPELGPILYLPGVRSDWTAFFAVDDSSGFTVPTPVRLARAGYDVYLATRRGGFRQTDCDAEVGAQCVADDAYWTSVYAAEIGALDIPDLVDLIISARAAQNTNICQKVTLIAHSLGTQEAMHALNNAAGIDQYVDKLINLAPCAIARVDWPGFPQPGPARRLLSDVPSDDGRRKLLAADDWADYKAAKKFYSTCLTEEVYLAFYNALRVAILADPTAWNADWRTVFDAVLDAGSYTDGAQCVADEGYTPDPALWAFWSGYVLGFQSYAPSFYGPTWEADWADFCGTVLSGSLPPGLTCGALRAQLGETCYDGSGRVPRTGGNAWPNCTPETHTSLILEGMTNAWYQKWVDIAGAPNYADPSAEPPQYDWTALQNSDVVVINNYVIGDDTCDPLVNQPVFSAIKEQYSTLWPDSAHIEIQGTYKEAFYDALLGQIGTLGKELDAGLCSGYEHHV